MIIVKLNGGLGNQLFNYAAARRLAHKNNTELRLDISGCKREPNSNSLGYYRLGDFNIQENFATPEEIEKLSVVNQEGGFFNFMPEVLDLPDNVYLAGGWANEKYFSDIRDILLQEFTLKKPLRENSLLWKEKILSSECAVSLHVRLGDYISTLWRDCNGLLSFEFYINCIESLKKSLKNFAVFVFSDNLNLAQQKLQNILDIPLNFVKNCESPAEELYLMSLCNHNIVPNSTFSWWAAWLNQNPEKKIFYSAKYAETPKNWSRMPEKLVINPDFEFPPLFSIILHLSNDLATVNRVLESVFAQKNFSDYEIIIIDSSADGSGKICRKFAKNPNVAILRSNYSTNTFQAWNIGLNNARGDYCLFLSCKNFIFSHFAEMILLNLYDNFWKLYKSYTNIGMEVGNWDNFSSDVLCALQTVEETEETSEKIDLPEEEKFKFRNVLDFGIDGKKFSLKADKHFKDVGKYQKLIADGAEKLNLLADKKLNTLLCTKIFKRKFLQENNIRFKENLGKDAELLFLAETFLQTDEIALINRTFCGTFK